VSPIKRKEKSRCHPSVQSKIGGGEGPSVDLEKNDSGSCKGKRETETRRGGLGGNGGKKKTIGSYCGKIYNSLSTKEKGKERGGENATHLLAPLILLSSEGYGREALKAGRREMPSHGRKGWRDLSWASAEDSRTWDHGRGHSPFFAKAE